MSSADITLAPSGTVIAVSLGESLMDAIRREGVPLGSSCDGDLVCGYCRLHILMGADNLSPVGAEEARLLKRKKAEPDERMACAALITGPVTVRAGYW